MCRQFVSRHKDGSIIITLEIYVKALQQQEKPVTCRLCNVIPVPDSDCEQSHLHRLGRLIRKNKEDFVAGLGTFREHDLVFNLNQR